MKLYRRALAPAYIARRHLDTVDVCKVVDSVADIFERQAKERQIEAPALPTASARNYWH